MPLPNHANGNRHRSETIEIDSAPIQAPHAISVYTTDPVTLEPSANKTLVLTVGTRSD
jgi:hypothetical protein